MKTLVGTLSVTERLNVASEFLERKTSQEVVILSSTRAAADEIVRSICLRTGSVFGVHRFTVANLAIEVASKPLVEMGSSVLAGVAVDALAARAVHHCRKQNQLHWFEPVPYKNWNVVAIEQEGIERVIACQDASGSESLFISGGLDCRLDQSTSAPVDRISG